MSRNSKRQRVVALVALLAVAACSIAIFMFSRTSGDSAKKCAEEAITKLFSCTIQDAADFNDALLSPLADSTPAENNGLLSASDDALTEYLSKRFGNHVTDACLEQLVANRVVSYSVNIAEKYNSDIRVSDLKLNENSSGENSYRFSAVLQTETDASTVANIFGSVFVEKEDGVYKVSNVTVQVQQ